MNENVVIIGSSYAHKSRIGLWFCNGTIEKIRECVVKLHNSGINFSIQMFPTNGDTWLKVCEYDPYFNGIRLVDTPEDFIEMTKADKDLTKEDVARYIVSKVDCNNSTLEELLQKCSAEYFYKYAEKLFIDTPYKFQKPLPKSVILRSRIANSENGIQKALFIDKLIQTWIK